MTTTIATLRHAGLPKREWLERFRAVVKEAFGVEPSGSQMNKVKRNRMWLRCSPEAFLGTIIAEAERQGNTIAGVPKNIPRTRKEGTS